MANRNGGYLVLGAEESREGWRLNGIDLPRVRELGDWIASLLRKLDPRPGFDVREWGISNGRRVAVIQVEPADLRPVSCDGVVYIRHGTQTIRADGPAIRRLSEEGARATRRLERAAIKRAKELANQMWVPFGISIARFGGRSHVLADPIPSQVLEHMLDCKLRARWRHREIIRYEWAGSKHQVYRDLASAPMVQQFNGWRAARAVEQEIDWDLNPDKVRSRPRLQSRMPKVDRTQGDRDLWISMLEPNQLAAGCVCVLPVRRRRYDLEYGDRAIGNAALMLDVLLSAERQIGARPSDPVVIALHLSQLGGQGGTFVRQSHMSLDTREWRRDMTEEAARMLTFEQLP